MQSGYTLHPFHIEYASAKSGSCQCTPQDIQKMVLKFTYSIADHIKDKMKIIVGYQEELQTF